MLRNPVHVGGNAQDVNYCLIERGDEMTDLGKNVFMRDKVAKLNILNRDDIDDKIHD